MRITVAAIQVTSANGQVERNLANATKYVDDAARQGADIIVCPEFLAAGYVYDESIWASAEPTAGPTERWLSKLAKNWGFCPATFRRRSIPI